MNPLFPQSTLPLTNIDTGRQNKTSFFLSKGCQAEKREIKGEQKKKMNSGRVFFCKVSGDVKPPLWSTQAHFNLFQPVA